MPSSGQILVGLARIANDAAIVAIGWHVVLLGAVAALVAGWRPSRARAALLLALIPGSVAVLAIVYRNPFNGAIFAAVTASLAAVAARLPSAPVQRGPAWSAALGAGMVAFGWVYPHFLQEGSSPLRYLVSAPTGLVPCPSLAVVIGFSLVAGGFQSRWWSALLGGAGLFYGLFGVAVLRVPLDLALIAGAAALLVLARSSRSAAARPRPRSRALTS